MRARLEGHTVQTFLEAERVVAVPAPGPVAARGHLRQGAEVDGRRDRRSVFVESCTDCTYINTVSGIHPYDQCTAQIQQKGQDTLPETCNIM